jgi:hypothetical protein
VALLEPDPIRLFLDLAFVGFLLTSLVKLKIPGLEAELTKPQEKISKGPVGTIIRHV